MKYKMYTLISVSFLLYCKLSFGQKKIYGLITDSVKAPMAGVTVLEKGTLNATSTEKNGSFFITVSTDSSVLVFSAIGIKTKEIKTSNTDTIKVKLYEEAVILKDIVITAYGLKREKKELGYSTQNLSGDEIMRAHEVNVVSSIASKVAGAQISSSAGTPGASAYIKIRGNSSVSGNSQPLFVIDGVPMDNSLYIYRGNAISDIKDVAFSNRAIDINPDDIETLSVLKGPGATALYGSRAAGGVVIITTKKGVAGKLKISYQSSLSIDKVNKLPELQNTFSQGDNGKYITGHQHSWGSPLSELRYDANGKIVPATSALATGNPVTAFDNTGNFFQTGITANNNLSFSGGNDKSTFYMSLGNTSQRGVIPLSKFQRSSVRMSGSTGTDKLKISGSVLYTNSGGTRFQQGSNESSILLGLFRTPPSYDNAKGNEDPVNNESSYLNADGSQRSYSNAFDNPYFSINENVFRDNVNRMNGYVSLTYDPLNFLSITYRAGTDFYSEKRDQVFGIGNRRYPKGQVYDDQHSYRELNSDLLVTLKHAFNKNFSSALLLGNNLNQRQYRNLYVQGDNLTIPGFYTIANASSITAAQYKEQIRIAGFFGQLKLNYKEIIYLELSGRNDWASTFGPAKNNFFYPSVSTGIIFSEWLKTDRGKFFSFGKIRASYAKAGKEPAAYLTQTNFVSPSFGGGYISTVEFPFLDVNGFSLNNTAGNNHLKPEVTTAIELGTDLSFFSNRIGIDFTWYKSVSNNQIVPISISASSGFTSILENSGSVLNKGIELMLKATPIKKRKFEWNTFVNFSKNKNTVVSLAEGLEGVSLSSNFTTIKTRNIAGQPYGALYGTAWLRNAEGKLIIDDDPNSVNYGFPKVALENKVIGNPNPKWLMGFSNQLGYKDFTLTFLIDIKTGGDMWNGTLGALNHYGVSKVTEDRTKQQIFDGVKASDGATNDIVATLDQKWYKGPGSGFDGPSEQYVEDASWQRLREISLGWSLPKKWIKKIKMNELTLSLFGRNLILLTSYSGIDPDTNLKGADAGQGLDYFNMPNTKSYGFSLHTTF